MSTISTEDISSKNSKDLLNSKEKVVICAIQPKLIKPRVAESVFSRSRNTLMEDAAQAEAIVRIGRAVLINVKKMEQFYDAMSGR